jgi:hypothetical protein
MGCGATWVSLQKIDQYFFPEKCFINTNIKYIAYILKKPIIEKRERWQQKTTSCGL